MKIVKNILCLLVIIGFFVSCSGDAPKSTSGIQPTVLDNEKTEDGKIKTAKLEGPEIVISNAAADQQNPHVIYLPDKNLWFSVYEDWSNLTTGADIKGKFINSNGTVCGSEITLTNAISSQTVPRAAYRNGATQGVSIDTNDKIMVAWQDDRYSYTANTGFIYYRTIDVTSLNASCSNPVLGAETALTLEDDDLLTPGTQSNATSRTVPKITYDKVRDMFWIAWAESRSTRKTVSYIPFPLQGDIISWIHGDTQFPGYTSIKGALTGYDISPTIIEQENDGGVVYSRGRKIERGAEAYKETRTYEYFDQVFNVDVACDSTTSECFIVWEGQRREISITNTCKDDDGETPSNGYCDANDIVASVATDAADPDSGLTAIYGLPDKNFDFRIVPFLRVVSLYISNSSQPTYYPSITLDPITKKFLVAWEDLRDGSNTKIYGQLVYTGSGLYNNNFIISYQDTDGNGQQDANVANSKQTKPFISYDSVNQRYFVIWQDGRNGSISLENLDVYGQYVDAEGSLRGSNYSISIAQANQYNPVIAYNSQINQFLAIWKDARNYQTTASDIYGQRFSLGQSQLTLLKTDNTPLSPPLLDFGSVRVGQNKLMSFKV
ncbi:MAG: hypothetical protein FJ241_07040, partial [Nitrospira sp.]|nr:hypothetical protein [Nitrospira sp.]